MKDELAFKQEQLQNSEDTLARVQKGKLKFTKTVKRVEAKFQFSFLKYCSNVVTNKPKC